MSTSPTDLDLQHYLDRDMSRSEEVALLARLSESERAELFDTLKALDALERLPRVAAPVSLARNVMATHKPRKQSAVARLRQWLRSRPTLGWEFGGAALAASVLFVAFAPLSVTPPGEGLAQAPSLLTPASHAPGAGANGLQFSLYAPQAHSVVLIGDFNGWGSAAEVKLAPLGDGTWSVTVPLPAGRYQYAFLIDGRRWVTDPRAEVRVKDDFGRQSAVAIVI